MLAALEKTALSLAFLLVAASGIVSMYAAVNAFSVYSNLNVFISGLLVILLGIAVGPLFCFIAAYGLVYFSDRSVPFAVAVVAPVLVAWCANAVRLMVGYLRG